MNGGEWQLYNIKEDPTELNDLSSEMPEKVKELAGYYQKAAKEVLE
jgi:arylsulfatase